MLIDKYKLELYWNDIPIGKENATDYPALVSLWGKSERQVRQILHELSLFDNGDDYILVRSASGKGFYRTDDAATMMAYRKECLSKGKSVFAPVKKINRVLNLNTSQITIDNNLRVIREAKGLKQSEVCRKLKCYDKAVDKSMLSKMENSVCLPTPYQLAILADIYGCMPIDLIDIGIYN